MNASIPTPVTAHTPAMPGFNPLTTRLDAMVQEAQRLLALQATLRPGPSEHLAVTVTYTKCN